MPGKWSIKSCGLAHAVCSRCNPEFAAHVSKSSRGSRNGSWNPTGLAVVRGRAFVRIVYGWVLRAQAVWVQHNGTIPDGRIIHHRNEDHIDDRIENLRCMIVGAHRSLHNRTQKISGATRRKMSRSQSLREFTRDEQGRFTCGTV
ncbi:hypothetical protein LCGC14_2054870 [marine sediment metagenome]|uniref:HNH nuclease domain-containing protein n=1 Tax=marine sediment metagenome TaxID=412755 RepID=A0A0F9EMV9_9ZZZZ